MAGCCYTLPWVGSIANLIELFGCKNCCDRVTSQHVDNDRPQAGAATREACCTLLERKGTKGHQRGRL